MLNLGKMSWNCAFKSSRTLSVLSNVMLKSVQRDFSLLSRCPNQLLQPATPTVVTAETLRTKSSSYSRGEVKISDTQTVLDDRLDDQATSEVVEKINQQIKTDTLGRLFCAVSVRGQQQKVTVGKSNLLLNLGSLIFQMFINL